MEGLGDTYIYMSVTHFLKFLTVHLKYVKVRFDKRYLALSNQNSFKLIERSHII